MMQSNPPFPRQTKTMMTRFIGALLALAAAAFAAPGDAPVAFAVGQQWSYPTRKSEPDSQLVILRIDDHAKLGRVVHVGVLGAKFRLEPGQPPVPWNIGHMPFPEAVLRKNVNQLALAHSDAVFPDFESSYAGWKVEADAGKKQFWTTSVANAIDGLETMLRRGRK